MSRLSSLLLAVSVLTLQGVQAQLPPPPVPTENPVTEEKRVLGKILFWDEQLSSCHLPGSAGTDPRHGLHPGADETFGTPDDVLGSPGVVRSTLTGNRSRTLGATSAGLAREILNVCP